MRLTSVRRWTLSVALCLTIMMTLSSSASVVSRVDAAENIPKANLPLLVVNAGQGNGALVMTTLADRMKIPYDYCDVPTVKHVSSGTGLEGFVEGEGAHRVLKSGQSKGTPYQTVVLVMSASLKGMGASGITLEQEVGRLKDIIKYCNSNHIKLVGMHVEGKARRGKPGSDNERIIDAVAPSCDYLIVMNDSNYDGRFTQIGKSNGIPVTVVKKTSELGPVLQTMFGLSK